MITLKTMFFTTLNIYVCTQNVLNVMLWKTEVFLGFFFLA